MKPITIAYSPDTDDAFMVQAMRKKYIDTSPFTLEFIAKDIETLNLEALVRTYDITAISAACYSEIKGSYLLMDVGSSVGDQYGPIIVTPRSSQIESLGELSGKRIAIPGWHTSAYHALKRLIGDFQAEPYPFNEIEMAVKGGDVDAGILIHELQLMSSNGLKHRGLNKIADIGKEWHRQLGLPLPLGANVIKRDLGDAAQSSLARIYRQSIEYALEHREQILNEVIGQTTANFISEKSKVSKPVAEGEMLHLDFLDRYLKRYVNQDTLRIDRELFLGLCALMPDLRYELSDLILCSSERSKPWPESAAISKSEESCEHI